MPARRPQNCLGPVDICLNGVYGTFEDELHSHRGGKMINVPATARTAVHDILVQDRAVDEGDSGVTDQMSDILSTARGEIVQNDDLRAPRDQRLRKMRTDESRP